ncbi:hypothetical protein PAHAL_2G286100 [Panicum hallii]|uniref:Uncharacterized protein n=1 Tax=Panicum hallii TaxID=206008 RepID=A0A2T8KQR3_9POAL|nr:hypothetical protein PAHAL_2G286100 [Panicum hallii]
MASSASLVCSWSTACIPRLKVRLRGLLSGSRSPPQAGKPISPNMQCICMHGCIHLLVISDQASIPLTSICIHHLAFTLIRQISCSSNLPLDSWSSLLPDPEAKLSNYWQVQFL